jgi:hypothetical protein
MALTDPKIKHLEMLQTIISRMNVNSFQIKGFAIAISSALFAFYSKHVDISISAIGIPAMFILWVLDSYYLQNERIFRAIYDDVIADKKGILPFEMPIKNYRECKYHILSAMFASVNGFIYLAIIACFVIVQIINISN